VERVAGEGNQMTTKRRRPRLTSQEVVLAFMAGVDPFWIACDREGPGRSAVWLASKDGQDALGRVFEVLRRAMRRMWEGD